MSPIFVANCALTCISSASGKPRSAYTLVLPRSILLIILLLLHVVALKSFDCESNPSPASVLLYLCEIFFWKQCSTYTALANLTEYTARYVLPSSSSTTSKTPAEPKPLSGLDCE